MPNLLSTRREGNVFYFFLAIDDGTSIPSDVVLLSGHITPFLEEVRLSEGESNAIHISLEELLTNIGKFGRKGQDASATADLLVAEGEIEISPGSIKFLLSDNGVFFDPVAFPPPVLPDDPLDLVPGGLGIHVVKQLFTSLNYLRKDGKNISEWVLSRSSS